SGSIPTILGMTDDNYVYFSANDGTNGIELWRVTPGASGAEGTFTVSMVPGADSSSVGSANSNFSTTSYGNIVSYSQRHKGFVNPLRDYEATGGGGNPHTDK